MAVFFCARCKPEVPSVSLAKNMTALQMMFHCQKKRQPKIFYGISPYLIAYDAADFTTRDGWC